MEDVNVAPAAAMMEYTTSGNHTSKNANGNIITLTLKNNHLIVETEERAVCMFLPKNLIATDIFLAFFFLHKQPDIYSNWQDIPEKNVTAKLC